MASTIKHFENGEKVWVTIKRVTYAATVLASSGALTAEHGYELFRVQLEQEVEMWDGKKHLHTWVHPEPIQGYKLKRRVQ